MGIDLIPATAMKNLVPGTTDQTWAAKRHKGTGPCYVKLGRKVYYRRADVQAWIDSNVYIRTDRPVVSTPRQNTDRHSRA
jgi:hypothetical protein